MTQLSYEKYKLSFIEYFAYGLLYIAILFIISYLFYDSLIPALTLFPLTTIYYRCIKKYLCNRRKHQLLLQFRDMINAISVSLNSGYSIENSIRESLNEMKILYGDTSYIYYEIEMMVKKLTLHIPIEKIFSDFASRSACSDIQMFAQILVIAKRNGGDLISIIKSSSDTISEKIDIEREIATSIASKQFEQRIMFIMPLAIMSYIKFSSAGFFDSVYHNPTGIFLMSVCLIIYILAVILGLKLSTITIS